MAKINPIFYLVLLLCGGLLGVFLSSGGLASNQTGAQQKQQTKQQTVRNLDDKQDDYEKNSRRGKPRDSFPVFDNPAQTAADKTTIEDQEYVIGIEYDGVAKAYPVAVMGHHELGNDVCGKAHITVSW